MAQRNNIEESPENNKHSEKGQTSVLVNVPTYRKMGRKGACGIFCNIINMSVTQSQAWATF